MKKPTKKQLNFRANCWYTAAVVVGMSSLMVASGVETAATFNGMISYALAAVAIFAPTIPCVIHARALEYQAERMGKKVHQGGTWSQQRKGA